MTASKKILMLHGYAQSNSIFNSKTGGFRKSLNKLGYQLYYPCGPCKIETCNMGPGLDMSTIFNTDSSIDNIFGWWLKSTQDEYELTQSTKDYLKKFILSNGPFHGIIGFSQGAALGGYLCTNINEILHLTKEEQPDLEFFINFSGFRMHPEIFQQQYNQNPINIPSLHIIGELDTVVEESRVIKLFESCTKDSRTLLKHSGGHFVPNSKNFVTKVINWIQIVNSKNTCDTNKNLDSHSTKDIINCLNDFGNF